MKTFVFETRWHEETDRFVRLLKSKGLIWCCTISIPAYANDGITENGMKFGVVYQAEEEVDMEVYT